MTPGDKVEFSGYELMAVINYPSADCKAVVVHNNSTHILAFRVDSEEIPPQFSDEVRRLGILTEAEGVYVAAWRYFPDGRADDSHDFIVAYRLALEHAIGMALGERSDES